MLRNPWMFGASTMEAVIWFFVWVRGNNPMYGWAFLAWAVVAIVTGIFVINSIDTEEES